MIVSKNKVIVNSDTDTAQNNDTVIPIPEEVSLNPLSEIYKAIKKAILTIKEDSLDPDSLPYFKTIAIDTGQFNRLVLSENTETETPLPAVFIHYTNVRYLVQQNRIGEGRATLRIRYVTNIVNNQDEEVELTPFVLFNKINTAIQDAKNYEEALNERCQLTFWDMPETTNMLQAYWIDYEVWFRESTAWVYRDWIPVYAVMPPFTNHSDAPDHNENNHPDHEQPTYEEVSEIIENTGDPEPIENNGDTTNTVNDPNS